MAKGQKRSTREIKKPKANKKTAPPAQAGKVATVMVEARPGATPTRKA